MYIYFDVNGTLKEIVQVPIREGSVAHNKIYIYVEPDTPQPVGNVYHLPAAYTHAKIDFAAVDEDLNLNPNGGNSVIMTKVTNIEIPYDDKRDLYFFKYGYKYEMWVIELPTSVTYYTGKVKATAYIYNGSKQIALNTFTFNVETSVGVILDSTMTQSQYSYLYNQLAMKFGPASRSILVTELPETGEPDVFYVVKSGSKYNIYIWNGSNYMWVGDNTLDLGEYYTKEEGEQFESDIDNRVTSVEDELSSVAQGSPKGVYATLSDLENAYPTGTAGIYVVQADGHWYYWNGSAWADGGAYFSAENVVSHSENQLKDSQGNNMFPLINAESIQEGTIDVNMLNNTLVKNSDNILKIKSYDGNAFTDNIASFDFETNKLVINGTTTSSAKNVNLYSTKNGEYNYMLLKAGTYYLHTSQQLPTYFFNVNLFTIKNKQVTTTLSVYSNKDWSFTLSEDTYLFRIQIVLQANTTFSFDGYIWLNYEENKPYSSPNKIAVTPDYLEEKLTPIEDELNVINEQLNPSVKPTIMFIFDSAAYDNRAQILETNGFRGTFDFGFDETSGSLGFNDLKRLITNGHDIGLYYGGGTNPAPSYDSDTWDTYISNGIECLNERGFFKPTVYGCKGLVSNNKIEESCEKNDIIYISSASIQTGASSYDYPTIASNSPFSKYLKPFTMHQHTLQEALETIDLAVSNNYILPLFCHKADGSNDGITEAHFIAVVNKVKTLYDNGLVDVLTYRGLYNKYNKENGKERDYNREMSAIMKLYADKY